MNTILGWDEIKTAEAFLQLLKENNITHKELKATVFGSTASKVIRAIKKGGQPVFDNGIKSHMIWWNTKHAIEQAIDKKTLK